MKLLNTLEDMFAAAKSDMPAGGMHDTRTINVTCTEGFSILLRILSPITPHICDCLWRELGYGEFILRASWPEPDPEALQQDEIELVVQVNGKLRGHINVPVDADRAEIERVALADENVRRFTAGQIIKKVIIVPRRLVNIVIS